MDSGCTSRLSVQRCQRSRPASPFSDLGRTRSPLPEVPPLVDILDWLGQHDLPHSLSKGDRESPREPWDVLDTTEEPKTPRQSRSLRVKVQMHPTDAAPSDPDGCSCDAEAVPGGGQQGGSCSSTDFLGIDDHLQEEEKEWEARSKTSGTAARLVIYNVEDPKSDIWLRGGSGAPVVVAAVRQGGKASLSGVTVGDRLASIDGSKAFMEMSADAVLKSLNAPTVLVFIGFVGHMMAEVRLENIPCEGCGMPGRHSFLRELSRGAKSTVCICEEAVFNVGLASLFLVTQEDLRQGAWVSGKQEFASKGQSDEPECATVLELQRSEARRMLKAALDSVKEQCRERRRSRGARPGPAPRSRVARPGPAPRSRVALAHATSDGHSIQNDAAKVLAERPICDRSIV